MRCVFKTHHALSTPQPAVANLEVPSTVQEFGEEGLLRRAAPVRAGFAPRQRAQKVPKAVEKVVFLRSWCVAVIHQFKNNYTF